jgi:hypothetical protein
VSEPVNLRKRELECMRLAADCMELAAEIRNPALQSHFVRMANEWSTLAVEGPISDTQIKNFTNGLLTCALR